MKIESVDCPSIAGNHNIFFITSMHQDGVSPVCLTFIFIDSLVSYIQKLRAEEGTLIISQSADRTQTLQFVLSTLLQSALLLSFLTNIQVLYIVGYHQGPFPMLAKV